MDAKSPGDGATVTLFFPPFCASPAPHLGIANLVAYQRNEGITCDAFDLNIRFLEWLTKDGGLLESNLHRQVERYRGLQRRRSLDPEQLEEYKETVRALSHTPSHLDWVHDDSKTRSPALPLDCWMEDEGIHLNHHARACMGPLPATVEAALTAADEHRAGEALTAFYAEDGIRDLLDRATRSAVVGINVSFAEQLLGARLLSRVLRSMVPSVFIVWGGTQITLLTPPDRARLIREPDLDALCVFEGEVPLCELARRVNANRSIEGVPNLITRDGNGSPRCSDIAAPVPLKVLPTPWFECEELARYPHRTLSLPVFVTRGCYWGRCTYCDYAKVMPSDRRFEERPAEQVVEDVQRLQAGHAGFAFSLITDALPPRWARRFAEKILERRVRAAFWAYVRVEPKEIWSQDLLHLMSDAGFRAVTCGAESTVDRVLGIMGKGTSVAAIDDNLDMFCAAGLSVTFNLIPDFPTATIMEAQSGISYVAGHRDLIRHLNCQPFELSYYAPIREEPSAYGLEVDPDSIVGTARGAHYCSFSRTTGLDDEERETVLDAYEKLRVDLERYHDMMTARTKIEHARFRWEDASFLFRRSVVLRSAFSLRADGKPSDVFFVLNPVHQRFLEIDASFSELVDAVTTHGVLTSFDRLCALVARGEDTPLNQSAVKGMTVAYVCQLLDNGLIDRVIGGAPGELGAYEADQ